MKLITVQTWKDPYGSHRWRILMEGDVRLDGFPSYPDKNRMLDVIRSFFEHVKADAWIIEEK